MDAVLAGEAAWDYVVVGAGSAGSVVASRLSQSGRFRVLLLEAGEDDPWLWLKVPLGAGFVLLSERSLWRFHTEAQANLAGRRIFWPRGRVLGGSSSINGMSSTRCRPQAAAACANITETVDLPTPPFLFDRARNRVILSLCAFCTACQLSDS